jgi:hypothetical protein
MTDATIGQECTVTTGTTSSGSFEWFEVSPGKYIVVCEIAVP